MKRRWMIAFAWPLLSPAAVQAQMVGSQAGPENYRLRVEYRLFSSKIEGDVQRGFVLVPGTDTDLKTDLGFEDDRTWELRGTLRLGQRLKLRVGYSRLDYKGRAILDHAIRYADTAFRSGEDVASSLKGAYWSGELQWDLLQSRAGFLGFVAGAQAPDVDTVISSPATGKRVQDTFRPVSPVVGIAAHGYTGRLSIEVFGKTFPKISGRRVMDFEGVIRYHVSDRFALQGGYRYLSFKLEKDLDLANLNVRGWVYGVELEL